MNPVISAVLATVIVISTSVIVLNAITIITEKNRPAQLFNEAKYTLDIVRSEINELLFEADGAKRSIDVDVRGRFIVAGTENKIKYRIDDTVYEGKVTYDDIYVINGPVMSAYESDIDNDGTSDLVLENDLILFAIRKISGALNTSDIITIVKNKEMNIDIVPVSAIMIDDMVNSSYGSGYTLLTEEGYDLSSSSIKVVVESAADTDYNATFTLKAGSDFVEMEVEI